MAKLSRNIGKLLSHGAYQRHKLEVIEVTVPRPSLALKLKAVEALIDISYTSTYGSFRSTRMVCAVRGTL